MDTIYVYIFNYSTGGHWTCIFQKTYTMKEEDYRWINVLEKKINPICFPDTQMIILVRENDQKATDYYRGICQKIYKEDRTFIFLKNNTELALLPQYLQRCIIENPHQGGHALRVMMMLDSVKVFSKIREKERVLLDIQEGPHVWVKEFSKIKRLSQDESLSLKRALFSQKIERTSLFYFPSLHNRRIVKIKGDDVIDFYENKIAALKESIGRFFLRYGWNLFHLRVKVLCFREEEEQYIQFFNQVEHSSFKYHIFPERYDLIKEPLFIDSPKEEKILTHFFKHAHDNVSGAWKTFWG